MSDEVLEAVAPQTNRGRMSQVKDKVQVRRFLYWLIHGQDNDTMPARTKSGSIAAFKMMYNEYSLAEDFELDDIGNIPWGQGEPPVGYYILLEVNERTGHGTIRYTKGGTSREADFRDDMRTGVWLFKKNWLPEEAST